MTLTPEVIEMAEKELDVKSLYEASENVTASHILFQYFIENTKWKGLPKFIYYIIMDNAFGQAFEKDENGLLGRRLSLKP